MWGSGYCFERKDEHRLPYPIKAPFSYKQDPKNCAHRVQTYLTMIWTGVTPSFPAMAARVGSSSF